MGSSSIRLSGMRRRTLLAAAVLAAACSPVPKGPVPVAGLPRIDTGAILADIKKLSSNEFEGRGPGTKGEELTVQYLIDQFKAAGLEPGNPDKTWVQKVPLVGLTPDGQTPLVVRKGSHTKSFKPNDDVIAFSKHVTDAVKLESSELVFVGYGVQAPEFNWDDYKGLNVKGKTLIMLVNDPPVPDPDHPGELDAKVFGGKAMTYYGRWTYMYEKAAELGAAGCLIVHETVPAGYPFSVVQGFGGERFDLVMPDKNMGRASIEGWLSLDAATSLLKMAGQDYQALKAKAATRDFTPVPLGLTASMSFTQKMRTIDSQNVIAKLSGSEATLKNEYVIYSAHWDHFGIGQPKNGDPIYHGAADNASGVGGILEIAREMTKVRPAPKRSFLFIALTAEEQGLLGSQFYAANPLYPLNKTLANINIDDMKDLYGRARDLVVIGLGASDLDDYARAAAAEQGRTLTPDAEPGKGFYYRSDHFNFAKVGVPAFDPEGGVDLIGRPAGYGQQKRDEYTNNDYHSPSDVVKADWDLTGYGEDLTLLFAVGYRVAQADKFPEWRPGNEFRAVRERGIQK
jgi:Zn-dependent M28 family amino/carboxypeptidase